MKKYFGTLMLVVATVLMTLPAQAQSLKWGVKGGVNLSKIDWNGGVDGNKQNSTGFFFGPMLETTITVVGLGLDAALLYSQRGKDAAKQQGVEIPVNLKYTMGLGSTLGLFVAAGPDFFFNFKDLPDEITGDKKSVQVALNLGVGLKLLRHLQIGVNYQIPTGDSFKIANADLKTKSWQVSAAILF